MPRCPAKIPALAMPPVESIALDAPRTLAPKVDCTGFMTERNTSNGSSQPPSRRKSAGDLTVSVKADLNSAKRKSAPPRLETIKNKVGVSRYQMDDSDDSSSSVSDSDEGVSGCDEPMVDLIMTPPMSPRTDTLDFQQTLLAQVRRLGSRLDSSRMSSAPSQPPRRISLPALRMPQSEGADVPPVAPRTLAPTVDCTGFMTARETPRDEEQQLRRRKSAGDAETLHARAETMTAFSMTPRADLTVSMPSNGKKKRHSAPPRLECLKKLQELQDRIRKCQKSAHDKGHDSDDSSSTVSDSDEDNWPSVHVPITPRALPSERHCRVVTTSPGKATQSLISPRPHAAFSAESVHAKVRAGDALHLGSIMEIEGENEPRLDDEIPPELEAWIDGEAASSSTWDSKLVPSLRSLLGVWTDTKGSTYVVSANGRSRNMCSITTVRSNGRARFTSRLIRARQVNGATRVTWGSTYGLRTTEYNDRIGWAPLRSNGYQPTFYWTRRYSKGDDAPIKAAGARTYNIPKSQDGRTYGRLFSSSFSGIGSPQHSAPPNVKKWHVKNSTKPPVNDALRNDIEAAPENVVTPPKHLEPAKRTLGDFFPKMEKIVAPLEDVVSENVPRIAINVASTPQTRLNCTPSAASNLTARSALSRMGASTSIPREDDVILEDEPMTLFNDTPRTAFNDAPTSVKTETQASVMTPRRAQPMYKGTPFTPRGAGISLDAAKPPPEEKGNDFNQVREELFTPRCRALSESTAMGHVEAGIGSQKKMVTDDIEALALKRERERESLNDCREKRGALNVALEQAREVVLSTVHVIDSVSTGDDLAVAKLASAIDKEASELLSVLECDRWTSSLGPEDDSSDAEAVQQSGHFLSKDVAMNTKRRRSEQAELDKCLEERERVCSKLRRCILIAGATQHARPGGE